MHSSLAIRMALELKLNMEVDSSSKKKYTWLEKEIRRRTWWSLYLNDRWEIARGDLCWIQDIDCRIYPPASDEIWESISSIDDQPTNELPYTPNELIVVCSSSPFLEGIPFRSLFGAMILLVRLFAKVAEYRRAMVVKFIRPIPVPPLEGIDLDDYFMKLSNAFKKWQSWLPLWAQEITPIDAAESRLPTRPWDIASIHVLYNTTLILLYRCKLLVPRPAIHRNLITTDLYRICKQSALAVTEILEMIMAVNPHFHYIHPMCGLYCVYHSAEMMLATVCLLREGEDDLKLLQMKLGRYLIALQNMSKCKFYI